MRASGKFGLVLMAFVLAGVVAPRASAAPLQPADVPVPLRPWVPWALRGHEKEACPTLPSDDDEPVCAWAGRLTLTLDARGGRFTQEWQVLARTHVPLPGDDDRWPLDVKADGKPVAVVDHEGDPAVELAPGKHALSGSFQWTSLPESLPVSNATGLVAVTVAGRRIDFPRRTDDGELFLQKEAAPAETDSLQISVHRLLADGVPLMLTTRVSLEVAGKAREVTLGRSLPAGFEPSALDSELPARIEADGRLRVQVRPGSFTLTLTARGADSLGRGSFKVTRPAPDGPWKEGEEVWVFDAAPELRVVTLEGVPTVDPQQTALPDEWKRLPAYVLAPSATLTVSERQRGDAEPAPDELKLSRRLWLDFDGGGFTAEDKVSGLFRRSWRFAMGPTEKLGRVTADGVDQFVTRLPGGGDDGVEIRQGRANLVTESRIPGAARTFPVAGWAHDFQSVDATLMLPPGWRLLHATGADSVSETWLANWTLLDLFLVLVCALAAAKLLGPRAGVLTLAALGLSVTEPEAPQWIWLAVLLGEALSRALGAGKLGRVVRLYQLGVWLALVLVAIPFAVRQVRGGLFPGQEGGPGGSDVSGYSSSAPEEAYAPAPSAPVEQDRGSARERDTEKRRPKLKAEIQDNSLLGVVGTGAGSSTGIADLGALDKNLGGGRLSNVKSRDASYGRGAAPPARAQNLATYDPSVIVQTGPGLPRWSWRTVSLAWNGPVESSQQLSLWLLSPVAGGVLAFLRVGLIAFLVVLLWRGPGATLRGLLAPAAAVAAAWLVLALPATARAADFPPDDLLTKLREGLLEKPACAPNCAALGRLSLEAAPDRLRLRIEVNAAAAAAVALPGHREHWVPADVLVDGHSGPQLRQDAEGTLWLSVSAGSHQVVLEGPLPARDVVQLPLPSKPHVISSSLRGWRLLGVGDDGEIADTLQLAREAASAPGLRGAGSNALAASSLPPFVTVERTLHLGLKWQVATHVQRATPVGSAALLSVPLLAGESPLGESLRISHGAVQVTLGPDDTETSWTSTLEQRPTLVLTAARSPSFNEVWRLDLGPIWHAERTGIPPIHDPDGPGARVPSWHPWPGEQVTLAITRPGGTEGQSLTIEKVDVTVSPGARSAEVTATLEQRSSRGGEHVVSLPEGATLESLIVDGSAQPLRTNGARVTLPLHPGVQLAVLKLRDPRGLSPLFRPRVLELGAPATNVQLELRLPADRWVLLAGGPRLGPAVLFWSELVILLLVAIALGRSTLTPLRARHWVLLGLGLSQVPLPAAMAVTGCLLAFGLRARQFDTDGKWTFDLRQLALVVWAAIAIVVMFVAVRDGLLSSPDMHVAGNGSSSDLLRWFSDRTGPTLPTVWVVSLPLLVYRIAMLVWALWLAVALIRWSRWAWSCFAAGGLWRPLRKPRVS